MANKYEYKKKKSLKKRFFDWADDNALEATIYGVAFASAIIGGWAGYNLCKTKFGDEISTALANCVNYKLEVINNCNSALDQARTDGSNAVVALMKEKLPANFEAFDNFMVNNHDEAYDFLREYVYDENRLNRISGMLSDI